MSKRETGDLALLASEKSQPIQVGPCNYLYCYDQTGLVQVDLFYERKLVESHIVERLTLLPRKQFDEFTILNLTTSTNTVRFFYGVGEYTPNADRSVVVIDDSTPVDVNLAAGSVTLNVQAVSGNVLSVNDVACGANATTAVVAANANNTTVRVSNPSSSTVTLRVGNHSGVAVNNGTPLYPGDTWESKTKTGVWVYNPVGGIVNVPVEVERA